MIVALDIASVTGCAVGKPGSAPRAWSVDLGKGSSDDARYSAALKLTASLIDQYRPTLVAVEAPVRGPKASPLLIGLAACVRGVCANRGVRVEAYPINSIRKHFLGRALAVRDFPGKNYAAAKKAIKGEVMTRCRLLGWDVPNHDAADAAALFDYAAALTGAATMPTGGLFV